VRGTRDAACGMSVTCRGAVETLSQTQVDGRKSAHGYAALMPADGGAGAYYVRTLPVRVAGYESGRNSMTLTGNARRRANGVGGRMSGDAGSHRGIDTNAASPARTYDYYLGGSHNCPVDRAAAERALSAVPDGRAVACANRRFLVRAVDYLAQNGIDQFIDIGAGIPASPNVHEVARAILPRARVAYVDNAPDVVAQNRELLAGLDDGVKAIYGDIRYPLNIAYDQALRDVIDFDRPVGVLFVAVLHFLTNGDDPYNSVSVFTHRMTPGSYVAISHITGDGTSTETISAIRNAYAHASAPAVFRTRKEIEVLFNGLDLVRPGLVEISEWRAEHRKRESPLALRFLAGVARKRENKTGEGGWS